MRSALMLIPAVLGAGVLATAAVAKEGGIELSSTPAGKAPGDTWTPTLLIGAEPRLLAQAEPGISIRHIDTGQQVRFRAKPTGDPRRFTARVVFPEAGWWMVEAYDGISERSYVTGTGQYLIEEPGSGTPVAAASSRGASEGGSFPLWPAALGGGLLLLAAIGAVRLLRGRRLGLLH